MAAFLVFPPLEARDNELLLPSTAIRRHNLIHRSQYPVAAANQAGGRGLFAAAAAHVACWIAIHVACWIAIHVACCAAVADAAMQFCTFWPFRLLPQDGLCFLDAGSSGVPSQAGLGRTAPARARADEWDANPTGRRSQFEAAEDSRRVRKHRQSTVNSNSTARAYRRRHRGRQAMRQLQQMHRQRCKPAARSPTRQLPPRSGSRPWEQPASSNSRRCPCSTPRFSQLARRAFVAAA